MRMFVALVPPSEAIEDLDGFLAPRRDARSELRWADQEHWHLTLAFMADTPERSVDRLVEELEGAVSGRPELALRLEGGGAFPNPYAARVLWTGVTGGDATLDRLRRLARAIRQAAAHAGAQPQGGPFAPHVTLARSRRPFEATRWLRVLEPYAGPGWVAGEVALVKSHLGQGRGRRPRYEVTARIPFGLAPPAGATGLTPFGRLPSS